LHALFSQARDDRICALCVTEADGNSPRAIRSTLRKSGEHWILDGAKRWTTLGPEGALFFVAARDDLIPAERPSIRVAMVSAPAAGLTIEAQPAATFVPEVPHAQLRFSNVSVCADDILAGDGYSAYVKPFRTVEDIHVNAAIVAYLLREAARLGWPEHWRERATAHLVCLRGLASEDASAPETHVALAGCLANSAHLIEETEPFWQAAAADHATPRWQRDRALLKIASGIRAQRTLRAWQRLRQPG
jgi:alkylation response protein AidB-like acyl-CoA dehydrogenase